MHQNFSRDPVTSDRAMLEMYQAFMIGYVRRINEATLKVTIGGVRIGSAKYTRLAQINLRTRIITFSRFALENVPERGRRYLVLHELAHVKEPSHNKNFWQHVERFEPNYKPISRSLEQAFRRNIRQMQQKGGQDQASLRLDDKRLLLSSRLIAANNLDLLVAPDAESESYDDAEADQSLDCMDDESGLWDDNPPGTVHGGSDSFDDERDFSETL